MVPRAVIGAHNPWYLLQSSMLDWPLMLWVKFPFVDRIQPQSTRFGVGVENMATVDSKHNVSPSFYDISCYLLVFTILHHMRSSWPCGHDSISNHVTMHYNISKHSLVSYALFFTSTCKLFLLKMTSLWLQVELSWTKTKLTTLDLTLLMDSCRPPGKRRRISALA